MKAIYRVLAYLVALGVVVQAAAAAFASFGLGAWIEQGGVLDKAAMESQSSEFTGVAGFVVHGLAGTIVIPAVAVLLLIAALFTRIPGGLPLAGLVVVLTALQVALGLADGAGFGALHGINALALFTVALIAARRAGTRPSSADARPAERAPAA